MLHIFGTLPTALPVLAANIGRAAHGWQVPKVTYERFCGRYWALPQHYKQCLERN